MNESDDADSRRRQSEYDRWLAAEVQRTRESHPNRPIISGPMIVPLFCGAVGAGLGVVTWMRATRQDSVLLALPLCVVGCAALGVLAGQLLQLFDRFRARRWAAGKGPIEGGRFVLLMFVLAIAAFLLIATVGVLYLTFR